MPYHVGQVQAGIPSREAPYVAPLTGQSYWQAGLSQAGGYSLATTAAMYRCVAKLQTVGKSIYQVIGALAKPLGVAYAAAGYAYHANWRVCYRSIGGLALPARSRIRIAGVLRQAAKARYKSKGVLAYGGRGVYRVVSICKANYAAIYKATATLRQKLAYRVQVVGTVHANYAARYIVKAILWQYKSARFKAAGVLAYGVRSVHRVKGSLKQKLIQGYRVDGDLANTIGHWFIKVTGKINIAAFVQAVPKRVQEFVTNKTWFK